MKKISKPRKSGYYWVGWAYGPETNEVIERIGYYHEGIDRWLLPGEGRNYGSDQLITVDERRIDRYPVLRGKLLALAIGCGLAGIVNLIMIILKITK